MILIHSKVQGFLIAITWFRLLITSTLTIQGFGLRPYRTYLLKGPVLLVQGFTHKLKGSVGSRRG